MKKITYSCLSADRKHLTIHSNQPPRNPNGKLWTFNALKDAKPGLLVMIRYNSAAELELHAPDATDDQIQETLLAHFGIDTSVADQKLWRELPRDVLDVIEKAIKGGCEAATEQYGDFEEEALTGKVFNNISPITIENWTIRIRPVEFSSKTKEKRTGADIALMLTVKTEDGKNAFKTLWFQAKKAPRIDVKPSKLADLSDQFAKMKQHNPDASFALLYSPYGVRVTDNLDKPAVLDFPRFIADAVACKYGTTDRSVFAESLDRRLMVRIKIEQPKPELNQSHKTVSEELSKTPQRKTAKKRL